MDTNYKIREVKTCDETKILEIARNVTDKFSRKYLGDVAVDWYIESGSCDADIKNNMSNIILLTQDNEIIGFMIWSNNQMQGFMIDIPFHGTGAAQYFCSQIIPKKLNEFGKLFLECFENNKRANAFYKKMGWIEYDRIKDYDIDAVRILYKLSSK